MAVPGSLSWSLGGRLGLGVLPLDHGGPCAGVYPGPWGTVTGPWGLHLGPCRTILSLGGVPGPGGPSWPWVMPDGPHRPQRMHPQPPFPVWCSFCRLIRTVSPFLHMYLAWRRWMPCLGLPSTLLWRTPASSSLSMCICPHGQNGVLRAPCQTVKPCFLPQGTASPPMGGQVSSSGSFPSLPSTMNTDWMSALCPQLWDVPVHHLSIPGEASRCRGEAAVGWVPSREAPPTARMCTHMQAHTWHLPFSICFILIWPRQVRGRPQVSMAFGRHGHVSVLAMLPLATPSLCVGNPWEDGEAREVLDTERIEPGRWPQGPLGLERLKLAEGGGRKMGSPPTTWQIHFQG